MNGRFLSPYENPARSTTDLNAVRTPVNSTPSDTPPSTPSSLTLSLPSDNELPTFEEAPATNTPRAPSPTSTTTFHTTTPDYKSDEMPMDAWDGDTDKLSAQDFLRGFHRDVKVSTSSTDKTKAFKNYLVSGSDADEWYKALPAVTKADMDLIDTAIEAQYPAEATLTTEEIGTKVTVADREVWAHHAWCTKMMRLGLKANVLAMTTYIEQVRVELPGPLRKKIGKTFADWTAFTKAVRDVDTVELELDMKEEKERREEFARMRQALQASPTAGIRAQLSNARLGPQAPARWPTPAPGANPFQSMGGGGQGNLFTALRPPPQQQQQQVPRTVYQPQAPRAPYQPSEQQQPLDEAQRRILLDAMARIVHHPDTEAGRRAHADQQQEWVRIHGNVDVTVSRPFPLRPGCAPANSGECFRCGMIGHTNFRRACPATIEQCVSYKEQQWRRIATQALKEAPAAVRMVGYASYDTDDYGRPWGGEGGRFEEVEDQGNA
ncbi:hypothetical protein C8R44DRAFT_868254 [Mycena epipterygia]|nr:hypothetical protein C8R44DRAFT_868254 [Mycena epipterygia]